MQLVKNINKELVDSIRAILDDIVEENDRIWGDNLEDKGYEVLLEDQEDEIIKDFVANYRTPSLGIVHWDGHNGAELMDGLRAKGLKTAAIVSMILDSCEMQESDYYVQWNEVFSATIGETEYQIDITDHAELSDLVSQATDEDLKAAGFNAWGGRPVDRETVLVYGNPCERVIWKLDPVAFLESVFDAIGPDPGHGDEV